MIPYLCSAFTAPAETPSVLAPGSLCPVNACRLRDSPLLRREEGLTVICGGKGWSRAFLWPRPLSRAL
jgi:hypothetical protein